MSRVWLQFETSDDDHIRISVNAKGRESVLG
jgi:hypothetical protein